MFFSVVIQFVKKGIAYSVVNCERKLHFCQQNMTNITWEDQESDAFGIYTWEINKYEEIVFI